MLIVVVWATYEVSNSIPHDDGDNDKYKSE